MADPSPEARCQSHRAAPAIDTCARCGAFVCAGCVTTQRGEVRCGACVLFREQQLPGPIPESLRRQLAVTVVGLLFPPALLLSLALGARGRRRSDERWDSRSEEFQHRVDTVTRGALWSWGLAFLLLFLSGRIGR